VRNRITVVDGATLGAMRRRFRLIIAVVLVTLLALAGLAGCQLRKPEWEDIPSSPGAADYTGSLETPLDDRVAGRVAERSLRIRASRMERLSASTTWDEHLAFRAANDAGMRRQVDRVPEPDAPVLYAEWRRADRTLFVVGKAEAGGRLVVLTALAEPR